MGGKGGLRLGTSARVRVSRASSHHYGGGHLVADDGGVGETPVVSRDRETFGIRRTSESDASGPKFPNERKLQDRLTRPKWKPTAQIKTSPQIESPPFGESEQRSK